MLSFGKLSSPNAAVWKKEGRYETKKGSERKKRENIFLSQELIIKVCKETSWPLGVLSGSGFLGIGGRGLFHTHTPHTPPSLLPVLLIAFLPPLGRCECEFQALIIHFGPVADGITLSGDWDG